MENNIDDMVEGEGLGICPFIGSIVDPDTARGYPSEQNCCYRSKPVAIVKLDHQAHFCLHSGYSKCYVFQKNDGVPLPKELIYRKARSFRSIYAQKYFRFVIIGFILILILGLVIWLLLASGYVQLDLFFPI